MSNTQKIKSYKIENYSDTRSQPAIPSFLDDFFESNKKQKNPTLKTQSYNQNMLICLTCLSQQFPIQKYIKEGLHQTHQIMRVSESQIILNKKIDDLNKQFMKNSKFCHDSKEKILQIKKQLLGRLKQLKQGIKLQFDQLKKALQIKQGEILRSAQMTISSRFQSLDQSQNKIQKSIKNIAEIQKIFKQNKQINYGVYLLKKKSIDSLLPPIQQFNFQKINFDQQFNPIKRVIKQIQMYKSKICSVSISNISSNNFEYQMDIKNSSTKKFQTRPTLVSFGDYETHDEYSTSIVLNNVNSKKKLQYDKVRVQQSKQRQSEYLTFQDKLNKRQQTGIFSKVKRLNSHKSDFHLQSKCRSVSSGIHNIKKYLNERFTK